MASDDATQGSADTGALPAPVSLAQATLNANVQLPTLSFDNLLECGSESVHPIGSALRQQKRTERIVAVISAVDLLVPHSVEITLTREQTSKSQIAALRGVGEQFSDGAVDAPGGSGVPRHSLQS